GKAIRALEVGSSGFDFAGKLPADPEERDAFLAERLAIPNAERIWWIAEAFRFGFSLARVGELTKIDPWFLREIQAVVAEEERLRGKALSELDAEMMRRAKAMGLSDARIAALVGASEDEVRARRKALGVDPAFKRVDTCAAEFEAVTPYLYSCYEQECEAEPTERRKVIVLGGGPNRIGQGIEFDYCCVHAAFALREDGFETIMVNCNPETVSTDYDTSDRLYFEPLTAEDVLAIVEKEKPFGVIVQFGGQTPLKLAKQLEAEGVPILGTSPEMIDLAEDRERFQRLLKELGLKQPANGTARSVDEAIRIASAIGYPLVVRPSYVLGGRAMQIVHDEKALLRYMREAVEASPEHPVLLDRFLDHAIELDVDAVADGKRVVIGGVMEHIEAAGVHSGDSACVLPPRSLDAETVAEIERQTEKLALALQVRGLINIQFAVQDGEIYVLEVNPRASRTVPFVSKATGIPLAKIAARVMAGKTLDELGVVRAPRPKHVSVKEAVFPFTRFPGVDPLLGPEMKSTGEAMGIAEDFPTAFAKAQLAAGMRLPSQGTAFISVRDRDKPEAVRIARLLIKAGFSILATRGTAEALARAGVPVEQVAKVVEGIRPHIVDRMLAGDVQLVVNTAEGEKAIQDSREIRRAALELNIPYYTTVAGGLAAAQAIAAGADPTQVKSLQAWHG
ncbi:MAG: carbamoyl-phosphate synthase large subunit, partial [Zetaproteobacteria bacterium]